MDSRKDVDDRLKQALDLDAERRYQTDGGDRNQGREQGVLDACLSVLVPQSAYHRLGPRYRAVTTVWNAVLTSLPSVVMTATQIAMMRATRTPYSTAA